ncbi:hypothetical protein CAter282_3479 [Collimonas arenae]|uniref:Uncharacterized protein n=1 Tax=Collimonas arenae TaxID=279058 RepID=A0A127QM76_9BURK|nr:hypothetical protein CAter282_3479 [Collimonas arenae]
MDMCMSNISENPCFETPIRLSCENLKRFYYLSAGRGK